MTNNDLINKIKRLESVEPSESWLKSNREFLFKYIDLDENKRATAKTGSFFAISAIGDRLKFALAIFQNRMLTGMVSVAAIFVLAGNFVSSKAEGSLPGDNLYAVKTFMEKAQLAFAFNDEKRVALNFELTEKRLYEFSAVAVKKNENSSEVKTAADNLKNQLKVAAQELNSAKNNSSAETAISVAKIADTKTTAYANKLETVKKDLSEDKQEQVIEVALNVEELNNSALAVLATNSKLGDINMEEIAVKLKEKIISAEEKITLTQKNVSLYEIEIKNGSIENDEAIESLALSVKLITEAKAVLAEAWLAFEAGDFSKTWDLLVNAGEIAKVADSVGSRVAVLPNSTPEVIAAEATAVPIVSVEPQPSPEAMAGDASVSPTPSIDPLVSPIQEVLAAPTPAVSVSPQPSPEASASAKTTVDKTAGAEKPTPTPSGSPELIL